MAGVIVHVVTGHACFAPSIINALEALVTMIVKAITALILANLVEVAFALLLAERHESWHHEKAANQTAYKTKTKQILDTDICRLFNTLLKVDTFIHVAAERADLQQDPECVENRYVFDGAVK